MVDATSIINTIAQPHAQEAAADVMAVTSIEIKEGEVKAGQTSACCKFTDFQCWLFKEGKCVYILGMKVDSMLASMLLVMLISLLLLKLLQ